MATPPVNVLVTTSRMPFAVDEIHKLGEAGNIVTAADTFAAAPGGHSRFAARHVETPAPTQAPEDFVTAVAGLIDQYQIDWLLPAFEEVFYLAAHRDRLGGARELFFPDLATLQRVHDKVSFTELCHDPGTAGGGDHHGHLSRTTQRMRWGGGSTGSHGPPSVVGAWTS